MCVYVYIHNILIDIYTCIHLRIYTYVHIYIYIYTYIHVYIYTYTHANPVHLYRKKHEEQLKTDGSPVSPKEGLGAGPWDLRRSRFTGPCRKDMRAGTGDPRML